MGKPIALPEIFKQGMQDFVINESMTAPFTVIQNRAPISGALKAVGANERIMFKQGLTKLTNEFGPNGESVFELVEKDARIRFIGEWFMRGTDNVGTYPQPPLNGIIEITFYGRGLNLLTVWNNFTRDVRVSVDGGAEGASIFPAGSTGSSVNNTANFNLNMPMVAASNLALGWHTVRIRNVDANRYQCYGVEIVNNSTELAVYPGKGIASGLPVGLSVLTTSPFKEGVVGTRGARVTKYVEGGTLKSAVREVDSIAKYFTNADHTNEEPVRPRLNFREAGANRADDFNSIPTTGDNDRVFVMDDDSTALIGRFLRLRADGLSFTISSAGGHLTICFVGTGLDIVRRESHALTLAGTTLTVDGVSIGAVPWTGSNGDSQMVKVCSGLPYGTHYVRFNRVSGNEMDFQDFIIYQPKKPSIPAGCFEVADYNVPADYAIPTSAAEMVMSPGVIRKFMTRETILDGSWLLGSWDGEMGAYPYTTTATGPYAEMKHYCTGFNLRLQGGTAGGATSMTLSVDGQVNLSAFQVSIVTSGVAATYNSTTGLITVPANAGIYAICIRGLTAGVHAIRLTKVSGAFNTYLGAIDLIVPTHINAPSLKVGSLSLRSNQNFEVMKKASVGPDLGKAKAYLIWDGTNGRILDSMNISAVMNISTTEVYRFWFEKPFKRTPVSMVSSSGSYNPYLIISGQLAAATPVDTHGGRVMLANPSSAAITSLVFFGELMDE